MVHFKQVIVLVLLLIASGCGISVEQKNQATSHYTLGLSHLQSGSPTMALKELLKADKINSSDSDIQAALAHAYREKKAYTEAEHHYKRALSLSDNDPRHQNNLAALYLDIGEWDKAINYFGMASENLLFMRTEVALMGIGYANFRKGDYPAAISSYREARVIVPDYAPISMRLGEVFYTLGQDSAAHKEFEKALDQSPNFSEAHYRLGLVLLREKKFLKASDEFRQVVELSPESEWGQKSASFLKTLP